MNVRRSLLVTAALLCAAPAYALDTGVPGSGLPSATDFGSAILPERAGVVSWKTLAQVQPVKQGGKIVPVFSAEILALDRKDVKIQGFMIPLDIGDKQKRFLISAVPAGCQFCMPAGPDALVDVEAKTPVNYTFDPIVMTGKFAVIKSDASGILYRMTDAGRVDVAPAKPTIPLLK